MTIDLDATAIQGIVLGLASLPICLWVAYTDLAAMRISNLAVAMLMTVFILGGLVTFDDGGTFGLRFVHVAVVLALGFGLATAGILGAGDAKFAAAMAAFVATGDAGLVLGLFTILLVVTFALHRAARAVTPIRALTPGWQSWEDRRHFPLGVTLATTHLTYLALAATHGV